MPGHVRSQGPGLRAELEIPLPQSAKDRIRHPTVWREAPRSRILADDISEKFVEDAETLLKRGLGDNAS